MALQRFPEGEDDAFGMNRWTPYLRRMGLEIKQRGLDAELKGESGPKIKFILVIPPSNVTHSDSWSTTLKCYEEDYAINNVFDWSRSKQFTVGLVAYRNVGTEPLKSPVVKLESTDSIGVENANFKPGEPPDWVTNVGQLRNVALFYDAKASDVEVGVAHQPQVCWAAVSISPEMNDFSLKASVFGNNMRTHQATFRFHVVL